MSILVEAPGPRLTATVIPPGVARGMAASLPVQWVYQAHGHFRDESFEFEISTSIVEPGRVLGVVFPMAQGRFPRDPDDQLVRAVVVAFHQDLVEALHGRLGDGMAVFEVQDSIKVVGQGRDFQIMVEMIACGPCAVKQPHGFGPTWTTTAGPG